MKTFLSYSIAAAITISAFVLVSSCKDEPKKNDLNQVVPATESTVAGLTAEEVAEAMANGGLNLRDFAAISQLVKDNVVEGYDERIYLEDITSDKANLKGAHDGFVQKIANRLSEQTTDALRSSEPASYVKEMVDAKISVYWPYASHWDGQKMPVIAHINENTPQDTEKIEALQVDQNGKVMGKIMVDEAYAKENPVMIVSKKAKPSYAILKAKPANHLSPLAGNKPNPDDAVNPSDPDDIQALYLGEVRLLRQYDPWICGGSELCVRVAYGFPETDPNTGKITMAPKTAVANMNFTREEIDGKVAKTFDTMIVPELHPSMATVHFKMVEDDTWAGSNMPVTISLSYKEVKFEVSFTIPSRYDDIYENSYTRKFLLSHLNMKNGEPVWHRGGDAEWTLPIKK